MSELDLGAAVRGENFPAHLADPILDLVKVEGLREAAEVMREHPDDDCGSTCETCTAAIWLELRADRLEDKANDAIADAYASSIEDGCRVLLLHLPEGAR